jgi:hypothetical protein
MEKIQMSERCGGSASTCVLDMYANEIFGSHIKF